MGRVGCMVGKRCVRRSRVSLRVSVLHTVQDFQDCILKIIPRNSDIVLSQGILAVDVCYELSSSSMLLPTMFRGSDNSPGQLIQVNTSQCQGWGSYKLLC